MTAAEMRQELHESKPTVERRITMRRVVQVLSAVAVSVVVTLMLGFVASRAFEVALQIDPGFRAAQTDYFSVGIESVLPLVVAWATAAVVIAILLGMVGERRVQTVVLRVREINPKRVAATVLFLGVTVWYLINWVAFADVFVTVFALRADPSSAALAASVLGPESGQRHLVHGFLSAYLSFLLGFAAWRLFPTLELRVAHARAVRLMKWMTVAVAFLSVAAWTFPRRLVWERFEVVVVEGEPAFVVGSNGEEMLLYSPLAADRNRRVRRDDPAVTATGATGQLFDERALGGVDHSRR